MARRKRNRAVFTDAFGNQTTVFTETSVLIETDRPAFDAFGNPTASVPQTKEEQDAPPRWVESVNPSHFHVSQEVDTDPPETVTWSSTLTPSRDSDNEHPSGTAS